MANNPSTLPGYNGQTKAPDANYPYGSARNDAAPGDLTGTPRIAAEINDIMGFQQALLNAAFIVPSGNPDTVLVSQYLEALNKVLQNSHDSLNPATLAIAISENGFAVGDIFRTQETIASEGAAGFYKVILKGSTPGVDLPDGKLIVASTGNTLQAYVLNTDFGTQADWLGIITASDASPFVQVALDDFTPGGAGGGIVELTAGRQYIYQTTVVIPPGITLNQNNAKVTYTAAGSGYAYKLGTSDSALNKDCKLLNLNLKLQEKTTRGVLLNATFFAVVTGFMEGHTDVVDNTRTNIGLHVDGRNVSAFGNLITLDLNHMHEGFRIASTGSVQATYQYFLNCSTFGDQKTDLATDDTSIGYNFGSSGVNQEGQGTVISGGNVEQVNRAFVAGSKAGNVIVEGVRIEIVINFEGSFKFDFVDGCDPWTLKGLNGMGTSYMEVNSGIRNWDSNKHIMLSDDNGSMRLAGFDAELSNKTFIGMGGPSVSINADADADLRIELVGNATGTGRVIIQAGAGSGDFGGFIRMHANSHATLAGELHVGPSLGGVSKFRVKNGPDGTDLMVVDTGAITPGQDNVSSFGSAGLRATEVFALNNVINTCDARFKTEVTPLTADELKASKEILQTIGGWQWLAKVAIEGDDARIHYGTTVQKAIEILESNGIDAFTKSFICYDEWDDEFQHFEAEYDLLLDEDGETILDEDGKPTKGDLISEAYTIHSIVAGDAYSFRLPELTLFLLAGTADEQNKINARLDALEAGGV